MESYVIELERDIVENKDIKSIMNKALIISNQLEIKEFNDWINLELKGYGEDMDKIPNYRIIECEVRGEGIENNFGSILKISNSPINGLPNEINEQLRKVFVYQSLPEIINICESGLDQVRFKPDFHIEDSLRKLIPNAIEIYRVCTIFQLEAIIDNVKYELLNWCSELKKRDIVGESYIFTQEEREAAKSVNYVISNSSNVQIGNNNMNIVNNKFHDEIRLNLGEIKTILDNNEIDENIYDKISENMVVIDKELKKEKPNETNIKRALAIMKNFAEKISTNVIASLLINHIDKIAEIISNMGFP